MLNVYTYTDYRQLLKDFYAEKKATSRHYSYRKFSQSAGLVSQNYLKLVMEGKRGLTGRNVQKFCKGLGLKEKESHYFKNLVLLNQADDASEKAQLQKKLDIIRTHDDRVTLSRDQFELFSNWYSMAVRELTLVAGYQQDAKWVSKKLGSQVTPEQVKTTTEQLLRLGFLKKTGEGKLEVSVPSMQTPNLAKSEAVEKYHEQMSDLAKASVKKQRTEDRCLSGLTFAVRKKDLPEAFKRIHEFRNDLDSYFGRGNGHDAVYQLNVQLFRLDSDE